MVRLTANVIHFWTLYRRVVNNNPPSNNGYNFIFQEFWAVLMDTPDFLEADFLGSIKEYNPKFNFLATRSFCMWSRAYFFGRASGAPGKFSHLNSKIVDFSLRNSYISKKNRARLRRARKKIAFYYTIVDFPLINSYVSSGAPSARPENFGQY